METGGCASSLLKMIFDIIPSKFKYFPFDFFSFDEEKKLFVWISLLFFARHMNKFVLFNTKSNLILVHSPIYDSPFILIY